LTVRGGRVGLLALLFDLPEAIRLLVGVIGGSSKAKKPKKAASSQKEMLLPIAGKKPAKEATARKPTVRPQRKSA
jgi:DNA end-binding protein Ku